MIIETGFVSYTTAFLAFSILTILMLFSSRGGALGRLLIGASLLTTLWAAVCAVLAYWSGMSIYTVFTAELLRDAGWCYFLFQVIRQPDINQEEQTKGATNIYFGITFFLLSAGVLIPTYLVKLYGFENRSLEDFTQASWLVVAVLALILIEQVYRSSNASDRWKIKYLCFGLAGLFAYDFYLYSNALLFKQVDAGLWQARGFVNALVVPLIAISVARNPRYSIDIHVSREVVFHSVTVIGAGFYLLAMAVVGYFIKFYGGSWGGLLQVIFLFGALVLLVVIFLSSNLRAKLKVLLTKHFFSFKYDYREEWLNFTHALSVENKNVPERILSAMGGLVDSQAGMLWESTTHEGFRLTERLDMAEPEYEESSLSHLKTYFNHKFWVVDIGEYKLNPHHYEGLQLPLWMLEIPGAWLLVPLRHQMDVRAFILLRQSNTIKSINWEDRDLLKLAGQQAAAYLAQYNADQALLLAKQFEAFNRLSAYVVHDLKNILAQQSLLVVNAEKHKQNPQFVDDMVNTIKNSVERMTKLMDQMRNAMRGGQTREVDIFLLLDDLLTENSRWQPRPALEKFTRESLCTACDYEQLKNVFFHLVQNAVEATEKDGRIEIRLDKDGSMILVEIEDTGIGMEPQFIKDRLFKPFDSTKGLTGMGIGAFESREYIRSLGGDIKVQSSIGSGTTFVITLPGLEIQSN